MAGPNAEFFIELCDYPVTSAAAGALTFLRTYRQPGDLTTLFAGTSVAFYFEISFTNANATTDYTVTLTDVTNAGAAATVLATKNISGNYGYRKRSAAFNPSAGNNVYAVTLPQTAADSNVTVYQARIVAVVTGATKAIIQIPLTGGVANTSSKTNDNSIYVDERHVATYGQATDTYFTEWTYTAADWADIVASTGVMAEYVMAAGDAGYAVNAAITTAGSTTVLTGSDTPDDTTTTTHIVQRTIDPANLTNATTYEVRHKSAGTTAARGSRVMSGNLYIYLANAAGLTKFVSYVRLLLFKSLNGAYSRDTGRFLYTAANWGGTGASVAFYFQSSGYFTGTNDNVAALGVSQGAADTTTTRSDLAGDLNWNSTTKVFLASSAITTPTDSYRVYPWVYTTAHASNSIQPTLVAKVAYTPPVTAMTTTASAGSLTTANSALGKTSGTSLTTTASSLSAVTAPTPSAFVYKPYGTSAASLTAAAATALKAHRTLTTAAAASLTAANATALKAHATLTTASSATTSASGAVLLRKRQVTTTTSGAALTVAAADLHRDRAAVPMETVASGASATTATVVTRINYRVYGAMAASLTTSSATMLKSHAVRLTTVASGASLGTSSASTDYITYTYAAAIDAQFAALGVVLRKNIRWAETTPSGSTMTASAALMKRVLTTIYSSEELIVEDAVLLHEYSLSTEVSGASLTAGDLAVSVEASSAPATIYLSTFACSSTLTTNPARMRPTIQSLASSANATTSIAALGKVSGGLPAVKKMTTYGSAGRLTTSTSALYRAVGTMTTVAGDASFSSSVLTGTFDPGAFDPSLFSTAVINTSLLRSRSVTTATSAVGLDALPASVASSRTLFTTASVSSFTTAPAALWKRRFRRTGFAGSHVVRTVEDTTNRPQQGGVKDVSDSN
jgi:hypothetical protein